MDYLFMAAYCLAGLCLAIATLPWRRYEWKNISELEYWVLHASLWPWIIGVYLWLTAGIFYEHWTDYLAWRRAKHARK